MLGLCFSPPPPPPKAEVTLVPIEDRLRTALENSEHLKAAIRMKENIEHDLQRDISYYRVKNQELTEILSAIQHSPGQTEVLLRSKAEQNAELSLQVTALRDLLNKSTKTQESLQKDMDKAKDEKDALAESQASQQRVMAQIHGVFKTLEKIEVSSVSNIHSEWINNKWMAAEDDTDASTVQFISRKLTVVEADRQRLLQENKSHQSEHAKQETRIIALERQIRALQEEKEDMFDENEALHRELDVRAGKIGALEELFQNINTDRTMDVPKNVSVMEDYEANKKNAIWDEDAESVDILSQATHSVGAAFASVMGNLYLDNEEIISTAPASQHKHMEATSFRTKDVEQELYQAVMQEAEDWKEKYNLLLDEHSKVGSEVLTLTTKVADLEKQATNAKKKAEVREGLLREVIGQYKQLEKEHSRANEKLGKLKEKVARLVLKKYRLEKQEKESTVKSEANGKKLEGKPSHGHGSDFLDECHSTFDTETSGITMESMGSPHDDSSAASSTSQEVTENQFLMEDYKRLESECDRLQHEFESAIAKISTLEEELQKARDLQEELLQQKQMMAEYMSTEEGQHAEDLRMAELRAEQAYSKQREREQDLWDIIQQYKDLAELNAEQEAHMSNVEEELKLTNRVRIQRRDLVYEYRKMEKALEEAIDTVSQLELDLKQAKSEAARNKEESKSVRKRLAGCHFHYKQLQEQYNVALTQKTDIERRLTKAEKYDALRREQAESWRSQVEELQDQRNRLTKENVDLQTYCEDLLQLASQSVEAAT